MAVEFDLFGNPLPRNAGQPGRNEHAPDDETARKIRCLLITGMALADIGKAIGLSVPTIRKHYFANGKVKAAQARQVAIAHQKAKVICQLDDQCEAGNVSAMKEMRKIVREAELADLPSPTKSPTAEPLGKKQQRAARAKQTPSGLAGLIPGETGPH